MVAHSGVNTTEIRFCVEALGLGRYFRATDREPVGRKVKGIVTKQDN